MRIVSSFKDYYDFPTSFYGVDEKRVFVRTRETLEPPQKAPYWDTGKCKKIGDIDSPIEVIDKDGLPRYPRIGWFFTVVFCDKLYQGYWSDLKKKAIYEVKDLPEPALKTITETTPRWYRHRVKPEDYFIPEPTNINKLIGSPVMVISPSNHDKRPGGHVKNDTLANYQFGQMIPPTRAFQEVYTWIGYKEPEMPKDPKDMYRFEAKGFDKKTSFRHPVK